MALTRTTALLALCLASCAEPTLSVPRGPIESTAGPRALLAPPARFTVIEFFSNHCPCQAAHDARIVALAEKYARFGVNFVAVDSEADATLERDRSEATRRGYPFPIVIDPRASIAQALDARFATYVVLLSPNGRVLFRGGFDSDHRDLHAGATPYLEQALEDALAGRPQRRTEARVLGCALRFD